MPMDHGIGIENELDDKDIVWLTPTEEQAKIIIGNYTSMVHRETDGPDPLVQESKGKP